MIRQGDILLIPCDKIALRDKKSVEPQDGRIILAYSEATGHHHSLDAKVAKLYDYEQKRYLRVTKETMLTHSEHKHILVPQGTYLVIRQREYRPGAIKNVQD